MTDRKAKLETGHPGHNTEKRLKIVFYGDSHSAFSRLHYAILCRHASVLLWMDPKHAPSQTERTHRKFTSFREYLDRLRIRTAFEVQCLLRLGIPLFLEARRSLPILQIDKSNQYGLDVLHSLQPDLIISAGFTRILPESVLNAARLGAFNCHPSPLPLYAGADPWFWILKDGNHKAAVTIHRMCAGVDAGHIAAQKHFEISATANHRSLYNQTSVESALLLKRCLTKWTTGSFSEIPQDLERRSIFKAPKVSDYEINWEHNGSQIKNLIRASFPSPGAWVNTTAGRLTIRRAYWLNAKSAKPGTIVKTSSGAIAVCCKDGAICLSDISVDSKHYRGKAALLKIGFCVGEHLS